MYKFTDMTVKHKLDLFDKLVLPVLSYGSDVWGFNHGCAHLQHCKYLSGVEKCTQNKFVYSDLGRKLLQCRLILIHFVLLSFGLK